MLFAFAGLMCRNLRSTSTAHARSLHVLFNLLPSRTRRLQVLARVAFDLRLSTVERIDKDGDLKLRMDSGREVEFNARQHPHLDYGYAVTSHSSQGQTADRVLIHVDSAEAHGELLNSRMAYVSVSRAQFDVKMYTNDARTLGQELSRDVTKATALSPQDLDEKVKPQSVGIELSQGLSVG